MAKEGDWPTKFPWRLLPRSGRHPYRPPYPEWLTKPPRGDQNGYVDRDGNEWVPARQPGGGDEDFHWDVEHRDGTHTNVRPDGEVHHGPDNF
ncbi:MAG: polymorphic toxin type 17 domain-containing protein [Gemmataceae bacterium]|nr:polymorphic toxin type 17 domain-containing protein [Gemmataceae bacterium]